MYEEYYLIRILAYLLNSSHSPRSLETPSPEMDWEKLLQMAEKNSIGGLLYYILPEIPENLCPHETIKARMRKLAMSMVASDIKQRAEIEELKCVFQEKRLYLMLLKGANTKELYPKSEWRTMGDIDIFYDSAQYKQVKDTLAQMGYTHFETGSKHDSCAKPPFVSLELHHSLVEKGEVGETYYRKLWEQEKNVERDKYVCQLSLEEQYIYSMIHLYEHFKNGGVGIRFIMDVYVFLCQNDLNKNYVLEKFTELGICEFARNIEQLAYKWFSEADVETSETINEIEVFILQNGIYGNYSQSVDGMLERKGRIGYTLEAFFPKLYVMQASYPWLKEKTFLLPVAWIVRLFIILFSRRSSIRRGINVVSQGSKKKGKELLEFYKRCGVE